MSLERKPSATNRCSIVEERKRDHITPVLASPHWLHIPFRIYFKILLFVFKALNSQNQVQRLAIQTYWRLHGGSDIFNAEPSSAGPCFPSGPT
ncbi:hypothetical protein N1851_029074 [Merluccius polli]|uniref:Uncharacterized protein n=1 Tax=Merluccius polli TaxID=89951 RepID=A0AA47NRW2_MERPO|nr:hypothetical protein N1851_029074 [Merluccius polli]